MKRLFLAIPALLLCACAEKTVVPVESVQARDWRETLVATGELRATKKLTLKVPGSEFSPREVVFLLPDGSPVKKGELVAKFDARQARVKYAESVIETLRAELKLAEAEYLAMSARAKLTSEKAQVDSDYDLSERFSKVEIRYLSLKEVLDNVQSLPLLKEKKANINWKASQQSERETADRSVVSAQAQTIQRQADQAKATLTELELYAPNDGVFKLMRKWDGSKPQLGSTTYPTVDFAEIPDPTSLQLHLIVPQLLSSHLKPGMVVEASIAGIDETVRSVIKEVGKTPSTRDRNSPVKFIEVKADIPQELIAEGRVVPDQAVRAEIILVDKKKALSIPNLAIKQKGNAFLVRVNGESTLREIRLGERAPGRSEVLDGLTVGDTVSMSAEPASAENAGSP